MVVLGKKEEVQITSDENTWNARFEELRQFRAEEGHSLIPKTYNTKTYFKFGSTVKNGIMKTK